MKLSAEAQQVLKHIATNIEDQVFIQGDDTDTIRIKLLPSKISHGSNEEMSPLMATIKIPDLVWSKPFHIWSIKKFLSIFNLFTKNDQPEVRVLDDLSVEIKGTKTNIRYQSSYLPRDLIERGHCDVSMMPDFNNDTLVYKAHVSSENLTTLQKSISVLDFTHIAYEADSSINGIQVVANDQNATQHEFKLEIDCEYNIIGEKPYKRIITDVKYLKMIDGDYDLEIHEFSDYLFTFYRNQNLKSSGIELEYLINHPIVNLQDNR